MSNEELKKKIQQSLQHAGVSPELLELDKAIKKGSPDAMYKKACQLLKRDNCKLKLNGNKEYWEVSIFERISGLGSKSPQLNGIDSRGEWFELLRKAAIKGYDEAVSDLAEVYEVQPYIYDCGAFFEVTKIAAEKNGLRYVDEYGVRQPYSYRLADIYLRGRVHYPSLIDYSTFTFPSGVYEWAYDTSIESSDGLHNANTNGRNKIPKDFRMALKNYTKAAELGSNRAMSTLAWIYFNGGEAWGFKKEKPNKKKSLYWFERLQAAGDYTFKTIISKNNNPENTPIVSCRHIGYDTIGDLYLNGASGVPKNLDKAVEYFTRSAESGNQDAVKKLQEILEKIEKGSRSGFFSKLFGKK